MPPDRDHECSRSSRWLSTRLSEEQKRNRHLTDHQQRASTSDRERRRTGVGGDANAPESTAHDPLSAATSWATVRDRRAGARRWTTDAAADHGLW
jgi:hypothetical protein